MRVYAARIITVFNMGISTAESTYNSTMVSRTTTIDINLAFHPQICNPYILSSNAK